MMLLSVPSPGKSSDAGCRGNENIVVEYHSGILRNAAAWRLPDGSGKNEITNVPENLNSLV